MAVWFTHFLHERIELALDPCCFEIVSDACESNSAVLKVILIKTWLNTNLSDVKTERKVEWHRAGLTFFIVNSGVPWVRSYDKITSALAGLLKITGDLTITNWCHVVRVFLLWGREWSHSKLFVSLPKNIPYPGRCALAQKIGNLDRIESCMLKTSDSINMTYMWSTKSLE